jgi:hypothetical protein
MQLYWTNIFFSFNMGTKAKAIEQGLWRVFFRNANALTAKLKSMHAAIMPFTTSQPKLVLLFF